MSIDIFKIKALKQDKRNMFAKCSDDLSFIPVDLQDFYKNCDPIDVEITMQGNAIKFYPFSDLEQLQKDYILPDECFIFATCNSDPIYYLEKKIYTRCHGNSKATDEEIAENFSSFLSLID